MKNIVNFDRKEFCKQKFIESDNSTSEVKPEGQNEQKKSKRDSSKNTPKNRCRLALVADHRFHNVIGMKNEKLTTLNMVD